MSRVSRTVRNFWLEATIDGRRTRLVGGPRAKDGGMSLTLYQRSGGSVACALEISCLSVRMACSLLRSYRPYQLGLLADKQQSGLRGRDGVSVFKHPGKFGVSFVCARINIFDLLSGGLTLVPASSILAP